jgi:hypothetical protein
MDNLDRARTMQRNFVANHLNNRSADNAIVAFVVKDQPEHWRFSLVRREVNIGFSDSGKLKQDTKLTPVRRYSFLVGKNEGTHTAQKQIVPILQDTDNNPTLGQLELAFNIETVTKQFFDDYKELFLNLKDELDSLVDNNHIIRQEFESNGIETSNFAKKLLGQIVFLYFLQKKGWMGVPIDGQWGDGDRQFLSNLFNESNYNNYFNNVLEPLFYEALAIERDNNIYEHFNVKIPFLNGGLFEPMYGYDWERSNIIISNEKFKKIFHTFNLYNFTVREDEPLEKEVAVDPEMLGKVFENLLEVTDRKSKGAFYTPREIVHYMCQESLINYLNTQVGDKVQRDDIAYFIRWGASTKQWDEAKVAGTKSYTYELPQAIINNAKAIDTVLANIKICDPAIGSGAFPVGMLQEIVTARDILNTFIQDSEQTLYTFKRQAIQESIYGVDIDPGAIDIAKLRLWLSLVVDENDVDDIKPLPNLDYKIVCGKSLLSVQKDLFNLDLFQKLEKLKTSYFNQTNSVKKARSRRSAQVLEAGRSDRGRAA